MNATKARAIRKKYRVKHVRLARLAKAPLPHSPAKKPRKLRIADNPKKRRARANLERHNDMPWVR